MLAVAAASGGGDSSRAPAAPAPESPHQRGKVALLAVEAGVGINLTNRLLSVTRLAYATPIAAKNHKLPLWAVEMLFQKSTIDVVPYEGGPHDLWGKAFAASAGLKLIGAALTLGIAIPNLYDAVNNHGGRAGILGSRSGRTGLTTSVAGVITLGFLGTAAAHGKAGGASGIAHSMFHDPILGKWPFVGAQIAAYSVVIANELGFLDSLDSGPTHVSPGKAVSNAARNIGTKVAKSYHKRVGSSDGRRDVALAAIAIPVATTFASAAVRSHASGIGAIAVDALHSTTFRRPAFLAIEAVGAAALIANGAGLFDRLNTSAPDSPTIPQVP